MNTYGLIHNFKEDTGEDLAPFIEILKEKKIPFFINKKLPLLSKYGNIIANDIDKLIDKADILVVFGGDGSMLEIARQISKRKKPILGVNFGKLGFLAETDIHDLCNRLDQIEKNDFYTEERELLTAKLSKSNNNKKYKQKITALNDIVIDKGYSGRLIKLDVYINDIYFTTYTSDGLIISTPTGSTAYNLSASGPIVEPNVRAIILTPINPHALAMRPMIISDKSVIRIVINDETIADMLLSGDGQSNVHIKSPAEIIVKKNNFKANFIKFEDQSYYQILREKLGWGGFKIRYKNSENKK